MGWKCTPQFTGLVRDEPKAKQKHRSKAERIIAEVGKERVSKSDTLDRSRTHLNRYTGFESGFECLDYITNEADTYVQEVIGKGGAKYKRKLRSDAVIGYAIIYNPPEEVCRSWDDATYQKFYEDSRATMEQICPDIFRKDNVVMTAEHYDEGTILDPSKISRHRHDIGIPKDKNGHYCGTKIDAKLYADVNKYYPRLMRERGWDIDDLDCTDWNRYNRDKDYREERKSKQQSGKSVNDYISAKMRKQVKENEELAEELQTLLQDVLAKEAEFSTLVQEKAILEANKQELENMRERLREEKQKLDGEWKKLFKEKQSVVMVKKEQEKKAKEFQRLEDSLEAQKKYLQDYKQLLEQKTEDAIDYANKLPPMDYVTKRILDASVTSYRGEVVSSLDVIESIRRERENGVRERRDVSDVPYLDSLKEKEDEDNFGMGL